MRSRTTKDIIKRLSAKFLLPEEEILKIVTEAQEYAYKIISGYNRDGEYPVCTIPGLGKMYVKKGRSEWFKKFNDEQAKRMVE